VRGVRFRCPTRISTAVEAIIAETLREMCLRPEQPDLAPIVDEIRARCAGEGLKPPAYVTVARRIAKVFSPEEIARRRLSGGKHLHRLKPRPGYIRATHTKMRGQFQRRRTPHRSLTGPAASFLSSPGDVVDHLLPTASALLEADVAARIAHVRAPRWIGHPGASAAHDAMRQLLERPPSFRPRGLLIAGPYHNGKTMIAERFAVEHLRRADRQRVWVIQTREGALACHISTPASCPDCAPRRLPAGAACPAALFRSGARSRRRNMVGTT